jgi:AbrB family looped-hinge helix DNA binding protein
MYQSHVSSKGQVVIPKPLRDRLGLVEGSVVSFVEDAAGVRLEVVPATTPEAIRESLSRGAGLAGYRGPALSDETIRARMSQRFNQKNR